MGVKIPNIVFRHGFRTFLASMVNVSPDKRHRILVFRFLSFQMNDEVEHIRL